MQYTLLVWETDWKVVVPWKSCSSWCSRLVFHEKCTVTCMQFLLLFFLWNFNLDYFMVFYDLFLMPFMELGSLSPHPLSLYGKENESYWFEQHLIPSCVSPILIVEFYHRLFEPQENLHGFFRAGHFLGILLPGEPDPGCGCHGIWRTEPSHYWWGFEERGAV